MSFSVYTEQAVLKHIFKVLSFTVPTNLYVALMTSAPLDNDTGSTIVEPVGGSYARVLNNSWTVATDGSNNTTAKNTGAVTFPTATALWGTITHFGVLDASTAGNLLCYGALTTSKQVTTDDTPSFAANAIVITLE